MATQHEVGFHLDLGVRHVRELVARGILPKAKGRGAYDLDECRVAYLKHLRAVAAGHKSQDGKLDLTAERAALAREQKIKLEMENAVTRGELISGEDYKAGAILIANGISKRVLAAGSKLQHALAAESSAAECRKLVEAELREALEDLASLEVVEGADVGRD